MNTRPITLTMAAVLHDAVASRGRLGHDERTTGVLIRRGLLERVAARDEDDRQYRITQAGREALSLYRWSQRKPDADATVQQPNVIGQCYWWCDFYGLHCEIRYLDDPDQPVRIEWAKSFDSDYRALRHVLRELTGRRHLLMACCPENHNPDLED